MPNPLQAPDIAQWNDKFFTFPQDRVFNFDIIACR